MAMEGQRVIFIACYGSNRILPRAAAPHPPFRRRNPMSSALIVLSGATVWTQKDGTQRPTASGREELVEPHRALSDAGVELTIATPGGRTAVVDEGSLAPGVNGDDHERVAELRSYLDGLAPAL